VPNDLVERRNHRQNCQWPPRCSEMPSPARMADAEQADEAAGGDQARPMPST